MQQDILLLCDCVEMPAPKLWIEAGVPLRVRKQTMNQPWNIMLLVFAHRGFWSILEFCDCAHGDDLF